LLINNFFYLKYRKIIILIYDMIRAKAEELITKECVKEFGQEITKRLNKGMSH